MSKDPWKDRNVGMVCATCVMYVKKVNLDPDPDTKITMEIGRCRKNAPTMKGFPVVYPEDWCGEHRLDENKVMKKKAKKDNAYKKIVEISDKLEKSKKLHPERYVLVGNKSLEARFDLCNRPIGTPVFLHPQCKMCTEHPYNGGEGNCECD